MCLFSQRVTSLNVFVIVSPVVDCFELLTCLVCGCRLHASFQQGLRVLLRSTACACQHFMYGRSQALPLQWSPFGWLPLVHEASQGGADLARLAAGRSSSSGGSESGAFGRVAVHPCFLDGEADDDDWDVVSVRSCSFPCPACPQVLAARRLLAHIRPSEALLRPTSC